MKTPLVSIITPAYNAKDTIVRAVTSVIQQDFSDWEMIIISDDNQDYQQFLKQHHVADERLIFCSTAKNRSGSSNARNKGLEIARGKYIASLDADDAFKPQKLSAMIPLAEKYGAAVSDIEIRDNESNALIEKFNRLSNNDCLSPEELPWVCLHTCSIYVCDRIRIQNLYYDVDFPRMQDFVFLMSFFNSVEAVGFQREPLHIYYKRQGSSCNSPDTHELFHQAKINLLNRIGSNQISIQNDSAKAEVRKAISFSLKIDDIYDQEIIVNPQIDWRDILKHQLTAALD